MNIYIVILIQQLIASGTHLVARTVAQEVDPILLTFLRSIVIFAALLPIFILREKKIRIKKEDRALMLWLSFIVIGMNQFLYLYGMKYTLAANGALLYATTPAFILILSKIILKEPLTRVKVTGVSIAFIGVAIVLFEHGVNFSSDYFLGDMLILVAVVAWSLYAVQGKRLIKTYGAFHVSALSLMGGAILFAPVGMSSLISNSIADVSFQSWCGILYLGLGTSVVGYFLWYYAIGNFDMTKVAVFQNAQPIFTTILSFLILGQSVSTVFIIGGAITITGVIITQRK